MPPGNSSSRSSSRIRVSLRPHTPAVSAANKSIGGGGGGGGGETLINNSLLILSVKSLIGAGLGAWLCT